MFYTPEPVGRENTLHLFHILKNGYIAIPEGNPKADALHSLSGLAIILEGHGIWGVIDVSRSFATGTLVATLTRMGDTPYTGDAFLGPILTPRTWPTLA